MTEPQLTLEEVARLVERTEAWCNAFWHLRGYLSDNLYIDFHLGKKLFRRKEYVHSLSIRPMGVPEDLFSWESEKASETESQRVQEIYDLAIQKYFAYKQKIADLSRKEREKALQKIRGLLEEKRD